MSARLSFAAARRASFDMLSRERWRAGVTEVSFAFRKRCASDSADATASGLFRLFFFFAFFLPYTLFFAAFDCFAFFFLQMPLRVAARHHAPRYCAAGLAARIVAQPRAAQCRLTAEVSQCTRRHSAVPTGASSSTVFCARVPPRCAVKRAVYGSCESSARRAVCRYYCRVRVSPEAASRARPQSLAR